MIKTKVNIIECYYWPIEEKLLSRIVEYFNNNLIDLIIVPSIGMSVNLTNFIKDQRIKNELENIHLLAGKIEHIVIWPEYIEIIL